MIGHKSPVAHDALRVLTIVHQLGAQPDGRWYIDTERQLQHLDHLVRNPASLAYVLMDQVRSRELSERDTPPDLPARIRQLLGLSRPTRHRRLIAYSFESSTWKRWDDILAYLSCRDLLTVSLSAPDESRYELTEQTANWLETTVTSSSSGSAGRTPARQRCALLNATLPRQLLINPGHLTSYLEDAGSRLAAYQVAEQLDVEDDLIAHLFQATFLEPL